MLGLRQCVALVFVCAVASCGYTDAGTGTQTLEVNAALHYDWQSDSTLADIWLIRAGTAVQNANVHLIDADTKIVQTVGADVAPGHYVMTLGGYARRLQLNISAENDALVCQIEGPGRHVVAAPAPGTVVHYGEPLAVRWRTEDGVRADSVNVTLEGINWSVRLTDDQGHSEVPARVLTPGMQTLTVERRSHVVPQGGSGHSHVDVAYAVSTPFHVRLGN
jgi:hypothetical protein